MYVREEVPVESLLKGSAAKMLLHLLRHHGENLSNTEIMRGSGVNDRNTFFKAKKQLVEYGLWDNPYAVLGNTPTVGGNNSTVGGNTPTAYEEKPILPPAPSGEAIPYGFTERQWRDYEQSGQQNPPAESLIPEPRNYRAEMMQADLLPGGGSENQRTSEFQHRRRLQVGLIRDAWKQFFDAELLEANAKALLVLTDNYAEDVLDVMEIAKGKSYPFRYAEQTLQNRRAERLRTGAARAGRAAGDGPDNYALSVGEDNYYLKEPTPQTKKIRDQIAKAVASGRLKLLEDDDD